jgi:hypothetical protein
MKADVDLKPFVNNVYTAIKQDAVCHVQKWSSNGEYLRDLSVVVNAFVKSKEEFDDLTSFLDSAVSH